MRGAQPGADTARGRIAGAGNKNKGGDVTIKEILIKWLLDNGFDGLANTESCGCGIDDLAPCDCSPMDCEPAKKQEAH